MNKPKITKTPGVCGGEPCIENTRLPVASMVQHYRCFSNGGTIPHETAVSAMRYSFPSMPEGGVEACLEYFQQNPEEILGIISEDDREEEVP